LAEIAVALSRVQARIGKAAARSGRPADAVRLVLVTKTVAAERVREAIAAGHVDLGENKVQEGRAKVASLADTSARWSMIGHLQRNKVKDVLRFAHEVQSVDRISLAAALDRRLQSLGRELPILIQVNTSGEASKYGLSPDEVMPFLIELAAFSSLRPNGFMTLATFTPVETEVRRCFRLLRDIRDRALQEAPQGAALQELSMGMSGDYAWAIEEGATIVRVGQAVFGKRPTSDAYYWPGIDGPAR